MALIDVSAVGQSPIQVHSADKRTVPEVVFPMHRIDILRPSTSLSNPTISDESIVSKNPFASIPKLSITKSISEVAAIPTVDAFVFGIQGQASNVTTFVYVGALETTGLTLGIHDDDKKHNPVLQGLDVSEESMSSIEHMIRKLFQEQQEDIK